jgi:hypothetical protein
MAKNTKTAAPATPPPPLPPTASHAAAPEDFAAPAVIAEPVTVREIDGVQYELHPVGMAQYIAELEAENAQAVADRDAVRGSAHEGFKDVAATAITHAARLGGNQPMAGVYPANTDAIPGIDAINAAASQPQ